MEIETLFCIGVLVAVLAITGGTKKSPESKFDKKFSKEKGKEKKA